MTIVAVSTVSSKTKYNSASPEPDFIKLLKDNGFTVIPIGAKRFSNGNATDEEQIEILSGASAVIAAGERYPADIIKSLPQLRVIARSGVGYDKVDLISASEHNVAVTITPNANYEAVAEQTISLLMAVAKSTVKLDTMMRNGKWPSAILRPLRGSSLGIVGLGRIGQAVAARAHSMKMNIYATEPYPDNNFVQKLDIKLLDLDSLLAQSDFVSLNCALTQSTHGLIDRKKLSLMKNDAILINTARGGLVVENDLINGLESGQIAGAGLDVLEEEPTDPKNRLFAMDNVVLSPHVAGGDILSERDMGNESAQCIIDLYNGKWPTGKVVNTDLENKWAW